MPTGFNIGPLTIRYYGIIIMIGVLVATWITAWGTKDAGKTPKSPGIACPGC